MLKQFVMMPLMDALDEGGGGGSDLTDVISQSLEGLDRGDEGLETPPPPVVEQQTPEQKAAADAEEAELSALEKDILSKNPQMRGNIAVHRHQAVLTRNRNQWTAKEKEYADAKIKYEKDLADWKRYEWAKDPDLKEALSALALAESDQKAFVEYLLKDERFANLISFKEQGQPKVIPSTRPGPNKATEDGTSKYYDEEGLAALLEWERAETLKASQAAFDARLKEQEKTYKPVVDEYAQRNAWNAALSSQGQVLNHARENWSGFKEHEAAIKKAYQEHEEWDLKDAYIAVVPGAYQAQTKVSKEQMRKELIEEMNKKPKAVGMKPGKVADREASDEPRDIGDVIRGELAKIGGR